MPTNTALDQAAPDIIATVAGERGGLALPQPAIAFLSATADPTLMLPANTAARML